MNSSSSQKLATPYSMASALALCNSLHPTECPSLRSQQIHLLPIAVSLTELLQWDFRAWASLGPEARHHGFWPGSSPGREELKDRRKKQWGKTRWGIPFITCWKICQIPDLWSQFSLTWSFAQRRLRTEESSLAWVTATKAQQTVEPKQSGGGAVNKLQRIGPHMPDLLLRNKK